MDKKLLLELLRKAAKAPGWQVVPVEPTSEMKKAGMLSLNFAGSCGEAATPTGDDADECYRAMLSAAPKVEGGADADGFCPNCGGSGTVQEPSDAGPDAHTLDVDCPHCKGSGSLADAYKGVLGLFRAEHTRYLDACGELFFRVNDPALADSLRHAAEYVRDAADPFNGSLHKGNVQWLQRKLGSLAEMAAAIAASAAPAAPAGQAEPEWIVNDSGELGVKVGGRFFFLYKGDNIEYGTRANESRDGVALHDDGTPMKYRMVGKREFGETCWPLSWVLAGRREDRYTQELVFRPGLSHGSPEDGEWKDLPAPPGAVPDAQKAPTNQDGVNHE